MKFSNILLLSVALAVSKAAECVPKCWSEELGYPCCQAEVPIIYFTDEDGDWSAENDDWCGILVNGPDVECVEVPETPETPETPEQPEQPEQPETPVKPQAPENVPKCQFYNCGTVTSIGEDGTFYSTNDHGKCYIDLNDKSCKQAFEYYNKALSLGYKLCKEQHEDDLVRDEDGLWAMEDGEWCGVEICPRCDVGNIDKYGLIWSVDGNNGNKCVVDKDNECKYTLQTYCRTAKAGYPCCKETKEVVALDEIGYWGIEDGKWCGINNPFSCEYYKEMGIPCCDQIRVNFNNLNMTAEGIFTTTNAKKEICGVSIENN